MAINRVAITINSRQYTVVADESAEYIQRLGNHINEKVETVLKGGQNIMGERPVVLAAFNICDEYFKSAQEVDMLKGQVKQTSDRNDYLEQKVYELKKQIDEMGSTQISMYEAAIKAEREASQKELNNAKNRIRLLEDQVRSLEAKLQPMQNRR